MLKEQNGEKKSGKRKNGKQNLTANYANHANQIRPAEIRRQTKGDTNFTNFEEFLTTDEHGF
jgi:hypothetical protein